MMRGIGICPRVYKSIFMSKIKININNIFLSVDGECNFYGQGCWSVFIRFAGCTVGCTYCDTKYCWRKKSGMLMTIPQIIREVKKVGKGTKKVTITGGEPLEQREGLYDLISGLQSFVNFYDITVETAGIYDFTDISNAVSIVADYKLKSAGKCSRLIKEDYFYDLMGEDFIKMVITNKRDFNEAVTFSKRMMKDIRAKIFFSPSIGLLEPMKLFTWMKNSDCPKLGIKYNLQIHKFIFGNNWRKEER